MPVSAPKARAAPRRWAMGSLTITRAAPRRRANLTWDVPMGPAPRIATASPWDSPARFWPLSTQASGSMPSGEVAIVGMDDLPEAAESVCGSTVTAF